ncbi:zinc finger protein 425-like [Limanda limanda]|uniref:zinc finger protein 425-like n=1 Tax=Limanda limanda TaxID=27771 RepID=UPI0029C8D6C8|nr:zinc finger protein 425-like [Limanda limanda]XP_060935749.1 zinc finger protein 425-like [Limanda limanda]
MSDILVREFRAQLNTALESVLRRAVCEIMMIFEGNLHAHHMELVNKGEEVAHLKTKLQTAEIKLTEREFGGVRRADKKITQTNRREGNQREPEAVRKLRGRPARVPEIDIEVPDDWCAPLGDEATSKREAACPSVRLRKLLIPLHRIPVIKQEVMIRAIDSQQQPRGARRSLRSSTINDKHKQSRTIILPVFKREMQDGTERSPKTRQEKKEIQKCTVSSGEEEREDTTETTEQETVENGATVYTCKVCQREFHREYSLRIHARSHTRCKGCQKNVPPRDVMSHNINCKKLKKVLAREADENLLLMTKKDGRTQRYSCPYCKKTSSSRNKFLHHIHLHLRVKPFACSVCKKDYCNKQSLEKHMLLHQDKNKSAETKGDMTWTMPLEDTEEASVSPSREPGSTISSDNVENRPSQGDKAESQIDGTLAPTQERDPSPVEGALQSFVPVIN